MASPPIPPSLEHLATRPFSFYPPIIGIEHNEWLFRKATWSEILVVNCKTGAELWISRRFIGDVSRIEDPVLIVGLVRELEFKGGTVWPYQSRVLQMPVAVGGFPQSAEESITRDGPAPVVGIRLEPSDKRIFKLIGWVVCVLIVLYIGAVNFNRILDMRQRTVTFSTKDQTFLELSGRDDFTAITLKLGQPDYDRWQTDAGTIQYRALSYLDRKYTVILMGKDRNSALYIGAVDDHWNPVHSVGLHSGGTTTSLLRSLKKF